jgi:hypothetical protein
LRPPASIASWRANNLSHRRRSVAVNLSKKLN